MNKITVNNKNDRTTVICRVEPVTTVIAKVAVFVPIFLAVQSVTYTLTMRIKPNVNLHRKMGELVRNDKNLKSDNHYRSNAGTSLEQMTKNWQHIDKCYPVHRVNRQTAESNKHIRRLLKSFLHYEASGTVKIDRIDLLNHNERMKFIRFLQDQRYRTRINKDIQFGSLEKGFLCENFAETGKPKRMAQTRHFSHLTGHVNGSKHVHLTPLEHMAVVFRTLPFGPYNSMEAYRYNF